MTAASRDAVGFDGRVLFAKGKERLGAGDPLTGPVRGPDRPAGPLPRRPGRLDAGGGRDPRARRQDAPRCGLSSSWGARRSTRDTLLAARADHRHHGARGAGGQARLSRPVRLGPSGSHLRQPHRRRAHSRLRRAASHARGHDADGSDGRERRQHRARHARTEAVHQLLVPARAGSTSGPSIPGVVVGAALVDKDVSELFVANWPATVAAIAAGWFFVLRKVDAGRNERVTGGANAAGRTSPTASGRSASSSRACWFSSSNSFW